MFEISAYALKTLYTSIGVQFIIEIKITAQDASEA